MAPPILEIEQAQRHREEDAMIALEYPATGKPKEPLAYATDEEIATALTDSKSAFKHWSTRPLSERLQCTEYLANLLEAKTQQLARSISEEVGKPLYESIREVEKCRELALYYLQTSESILQAKRGQTPSDGRQLVPTPLGTILCVSPSNFPLWQVVRASLPILIAGNTVINKPAPAGDTISRHLEAALVKAGFPPNAFQVLQAKPDAVMELIAHPEVKGIAFTGGRAVGRLIGAASGQALKPCVLELGGNDPALILESANLSEAIAQCVAARFYNNGQTCLGPKRFIVHKSHYASALKQIQTMASAYLDGDPMESTTKRGPMVSYSARQRLHDQVVTAQKQGATLLLGGVIENRKGAYYPSTLLADVEPDNIVYQEELFGPVIAVSRAESTAHALELANSSRFGLAASIFSRDSTEARSIAAQLNVANVGWNAIARSNVAYPFGGILESGFGRELGPDGLLNFTYPKTYSGFDEPVP